MKTSLQAIRSNMHSEQAETELQAQDSTPILMPSPRALSQIRLFTMPRGGLDRLSFRTWDTISVLVPDEKPIEDTIELRGHYVIERRDPTSADWRSAAVDIFMRELSVTGTSQKFGRVHARLNDHIGNVSGGQVRAGTIYDSPVDSPKMCEMMGYMLFELSDIGATVFNKEPIQLQHSITHIPPIGQGGGTREGVEVALYRIDDPDGRPAAVLHRVKTHIGAWLEE